MKYIKRIVQIVITIGLIAFIFYKYIDLEKLANLIEKIDYIYILPSLILIYAQRLIETYNIKINLEVFNIDEPFLKIFKYKLISNFYSLMLPSGIIAGGVTWYLLSKDNGKRAQVGSVLVYNKLVYFATFIPIVFIGFLFEPRLNELNIGIYLMIFTIVLILGISIFFFEPSYQLFKRISTFFVNLIKIKRLNKINNEIWNSIKLSHSLPLKNIIIIWSFSFIYNVLIVIFMYLFMFMVDIKLQFYVPIILLIINTLVYNLPFSINGYGVKEISYIWVLDSFYHIPSEKSLLLSLGSSIFTIFFIGLPGAFLSMNTKLTKES